MIDTEPKLEQCARCSAYVWTAQSSGLRVTADPGPVDTQHLVATLAGRLRLFEVAETAGRPQKLITRSRWSPRPTTDATGALRGAQGRRIVAEHPCGSLVASQAVQPLAATDPHQARATHGVRAGGETTDAHARQQNYAVKGHSSATAHCPSVADSANRPRFDPPPVWYKPPPKSERIAKCDICGEYVMQSQMHVGLQIGAAWIFIYHERCTT